MRDSSRRVMSSAKAGRKGRACRRRRRRRRDVRATDKNNDLKSIESARRDHHLGVNGERVCGGGKA